MTDHLQQLGKYQIIEELGRGGFATVHRAEDTTLGREVALKVLHPQLLTDPTFVERFKREARALAGLDHPHIVTIYEIGESQGRLFIAMKLVEGSSLKDLIAQKGVFSWNETIEVLEQVADALDYAHDQGILHRDLKPANILIGEHGVVVTDFGFAKLVGESSVSVSISGGMVGTPHYIAPEVWREEGAVPQTDVYALACIAAEMLTGAVLFSGGTPAGVMTKHLIDGPRFSTVLPKEIPSVVAKILEKALAQEPEARYSTASAMVTPLRAAMTIRPHSSNRIFSRPQYSNWKDMMPGWLLVFTLMWAGVIIVIGLCIGLQVLPAQYANTTPAQLRSDFRDDYLLCIAADYATHHDIEIAQHQLGIGYWRSDPIQALEDLALQLDGQDSANVLALAEDLRGLDTPLSVSTLAETGVSSQTGLLLMALSMLIAAFAPLILSVIGLKLVRWGRKKASRKGKRY